MKRQTTVDLKGKACPLPVIETKRIYDSLQSGEAVTVVVDNRLSGENVCTFVRESGGVADMHEGGGAWEIRVEKRTEGRSGPAPEFCPSTPAGGMVYISSSTMGEGSEELGEMLLKAFINTLDTLDPLPAQVVFINGGIRFTTEPGPAVDVLKRLEQKGTEILSCGTCLNFFAKENDLLVGRVTNMYDILQLLARSPRVIRP